MARCWRCGVDFDDTDYLQGVPCPDCQLEDMSIEYRKLNVVAELEAKRRDELVREGWEDMQPDNRIGAAIGLATHQVRRVRVRLGLEGHQFNGADLWDNADEVRKKQSDGAKAYWANPENRAKRKNGRGKPVEGTLSTPEAVRTMREEDRFYAPTGKNNRKAKSLDTFVDQRTVR